VSIIQVFILEVNNILMFFYKKIKKPALRLVINVFDGVLVLNGALFEISARAHYPVKTGSFILSIEYFSFRVGSI